MWRHGSESTLARVMASCMAALSHCLNQSWLIISEVQRYLSEANFGSDTSTIISSLPQYLAPTTLNSFEESLNPFVLYHLPTQIVTDCSNHYSNAPPLLTRVFNKMIALIMAIQGTKYLISDRRFAHKAWEDAEFQSTMFFTCIGYWYKTPLAPYWENCNRKWYITNPAKHICKRLLLYRLLQPSECCRSGVWWNNGFNSNLIFGNIATSRVYTTLTSHYLKTSNLQFAYKERHSTAMCTLALKEVAKYYTSRRGRVYCCLLDATKAFDRVRFDTLFEILIERNVPACIIRILIDMYTRQTVRTVWEGCVSEEFSANNGVRQGGVLSPVLFTLYIDVLLNR